MGQETSLNCRSSQKQQQHEIETTQSNALQMLKSQQTSGLSSDIKSHKSTARDSELPRSVVPSNPVSQPLPQHENILRVSASPFPNCEKLGNKFIEIGGKSLAEIVEGRYNTNMHFPASQVIGLLESTAYSLAYMNAEGYYHHDIYPTNIFYSSGLFKLTNPLSVEASGYVLTQQRKRFSFLAPELISEILNETLETEIPDDILFAGDVFAAGMVLLQFCTLQPSAECYDEESYSLVDRTIKQRIAKVSRLYSPRIAECLAAMLVYEIDDRISIHQLSIAVFLNSPREKAAEAQTTQTRNSKAGPAAIPSAPNSRPQYQLNPVHVQPHYLILPPGQAPSSGQTQGQPVSLNGNNIAIPTPNYAYSRIGPNNQALLSPTTLSNKLRVIQLIHEKPQEQEESQGQLSNLPSHLLPTSSSQPISYQPSPPLPAHQVRPHLMQPAIKDPPKATQSQQPTTKPFQYQPPAIPASPQYNPSQDIPVSDKHNYYYPSQNFQKKIEKPNSPSYAYPGRFQVDENGETLEQRVERILQMSRSIK